MEADVYLSARRALLSAVLAVFDLVVPILADYFNSFFQNAEAVVNAIEVEVVLNCFYSVAYGIVHLERETESDLQMVREAFRFISNCLNFESIRVVSYAIQYLEFFACNLSQSFDFRQHIEPLMIHFRDSLSASASSCIAEILSRAYISLISQVFLALFEFETYDSIHCIFSVLSMVRSADLIAPFFERTIHLATRFANEDQKESTMKLDCILELLDLMIAVIGKEASAFLNDLFSFLRDCFLRFHCYFALRSMCSIASLTKNQLFVQATLTQLIPAISEDSPFDQQTIAVGCIDILADCDIQAQFHVIMAALLSLIHSTDADSVKIDCLEAINALHFHWPTLTNPYYGRLLPLLETGLGNIGTAYEDSEETRLMTAILTAIKLMLMSGQGREVVEGLAIKAINLALEMKGWTTAAMFELCSVLNLMIKQRGQKMRDWIRGNADLMQILTDEEWLEHAGEEVGKLIAIILRELNC
jgi:hypothetical protein